MPYFIYHIGSLGVLKKLGQADEFKSAKVQVSELRKTIDANSGATVRMIFAANELAAEDILSQPREKDLTLAGDDY